MIASQFRRVVKDKNNNTQRVDLVHSLRRDDLPMTELKPVEEECYKPDSINYRDDSKQQRGGWEIVIVLVIVVCLLYFTYDFISDINVSDSQVGVVDIWKEYYKQQKNGRVVVLESLKVNLGPIKTEVWEKFLDDYTRFLDCKNGKVSCKSFYTSTEM